MIERVRIGLIGAGWAAENRHLPALSQVAEAQVCSVWSRRHETAQRVAERFEIPHVANDWREIVSSSDVDAVVIATPPVLHQPATLAAIEMGKHVLCQARMARNLKEALEMTAAVEASGLVGALYPAKPGLKGDRVMHRLLHDDQIVGAIREVRVTSFAFSDTAGKYQWLMDPDVVGVHAMTLGMWNEVANRWVGPAKKVTVQVHTHQPHRSTPDGSQVAAIVPDSLAAAASLHCGATASFHISTHTGGIPQHTLSVHGPNGSLTYRFFDEEIEAVQENGIVESIPISPDEERLQDTDVLFVRAIRDGGVVSPDFREGLAYMEFCEAVAFSAYTEGSVGVPPDRPLMDAWGRTL